MIDLIVFIVCIPLMWFYGVTLACVIWYVYLAVAYRGTWLYYRNGEQCSVAAFFWSLIVCSPAKMVYQPQHYYRCLHLVSLFNNGWVKCDSSEYTRRLVKGEQVKKL